MLVKKIIVGVFMLILGCVLFSEDCLAIRLLTKEQALKKMFPDVDEIVTETKVLTDSEIAKIKERLGGKLVNYQKGSESEGIEETSTYTFYFGIKNNQKIRVAIIEEQPGKWGPVKYIIALDMSSGKIQNLAVMSYKEKRGRPIARRNFLKQFLGKSCTDPISVKTTKKGNKRIRKDIRAISGATISSDATCFAVKKAIAIYEESVQKELLQAASQKP